jgi:NIMA (never in mitosis gene a)-related kinase 1/4/5
MNSYRFLSHLGSGSYGVASLVLDSCGEKRVIKAVQLNKAAINEVEILKSLKHPYIVHFCDSFTENHTLHIVMDYAELGDLRSLLDDLHKKHRKLSLPHVIRYFTQCTLALSYLHEKSIIYRDLKTPNCFIKSNNRLVLGDFGISKNLSKKPSSSSTPHSSSSSSSSCFTKTATGTPFYVSPEMYSRNGYTFASDIWALGCLLYEMTTNQALFGNSKSHLDLINRILSDPIPPLPSDHIFLKQIFSNCMKRNFHKRISAQEILKFECIRSEILIMAKELRS